MQLTFTHKTLRELCEQEAAALNRFGARVAEQLKNRLADLHAASSLADFSAICSQSLLDSSDGEKSVELCDGLWLVLTSSQKDAPRDAVGNVDWTRVKRVKILDIRQGPTDE